MGIVKSRHEESVDATRAALLDSAIELFAAKGFAATSLEDVATAARVTKGALYHHFRGGKLALFEAVFTEVDARLADRIVAATPPDAGPWELVEAGLDAYLEACTDPAIRKIIFHEGQVALGWERWRELDGCSSRELLAHVISDLVDQGLIRPQPVELLTRLLFATLGEAGMSVGEADDPGAARDQARELIVSMVRGLQP